MAVAHSSVVTRVVDYEPPLTDVPPETATTRSASGAAAITTRHLHAMPVAGPPSAARRAAAAFSDAAMRCVLEVIDQRRPGAQLRPLLAGGLADTVLALRRPRVDGKGRPHAAAVLRRVRLQAVDPHEGAFEVAATYSRGPRLHALACRVELAPTSQGQRWQVVALHIG